MKFIVPWMVRLQFTTRKIAEYLHDSEEGQGLIEYTLILSLVAVLVIVSLKFLQPAINVALNRVSNTL